MKKEKDSRHIVDILFVIALFSTFALSAIFIISIGAKIYSRTMDTMNQNFNSRTASAYIIEKIHQSDDNGCVDIGQLEGCPAIIISSTHNDKKYLTYIYEYKNKLKELMVRENVSLSPEAGQTIIDVNYFNLEKVNDKLVHCFLELSGEENYDFYICLHSGGVDEF